MSNSLHRNTPTLKAMDPRGLAVRTLQYHRENVTQTPQARVTRQVFGTSGLLLGQWDPRQLARGAVGVASQSNIYSLSGEPVHTESADAGWRLVLRGEAGQLLHRWDSRQAHQEWRYDRVLRPVAVFEQAADEPRPRCVERLTYAAAEPAEAAGNRCGQLIRHADPAGVLWMDEYGVGGSLINQTRRFRMDTSTVDWPSSDDKQAEQLVGEAHTTTWRYDALGALLEQVDAKDNRRHWRYGQQGWLKEVALTLKGGTRQVLMDQRVYNANGQAESERAGNDVTKVAKYAAEDYRLLQLTVYRKGEATTPLQDLVYEYDPVGNILSLSDQAQPTQWHSNARIDAVSRYQYDTLYQLTQASGRENVGNRGQAAPGRVTFGATDPGLWRNYTQHYTYDENGNLTRLRHVPGSGTGYTQDMRVAAGSNRALSVTDGAPDPLGDVDGLNLYAMVLGNPLRFRDADGTQTSFGEQFQPGRGDIIFGLAHTVGSYRSFWSILSGRGDTMAAYFPGADLQRWTAGLGSNVRQFFTFRELAPVEFTDLVTPVPGEDSIATRLKAELREQISANVQPFYEGIVARYSGCTATTCNQQFARRFVRNLAAGKYSAEATAIQFIGEGLLGIQQKLVNRSSKSALETLTDPQSNAVVHFALDDLAIGQVVKKSRPSATASELRWLYRHRAQLGGRVIFYRGQRRVDAPWEANPAKWSAYSPRSATPARAGRRR